MALSEYVSDDAILNGLTNTLKVKPLLSALSSREAASISEYADPSYTKPLVVVYGTADDYLKCDQTQRKTGGIWRQYYDKTANVVMRAFDPSRQDEIEIIDVNVVDIRDFLHSIYMGDPTAIAALLNGTFYQEIGEIKTRLINIALARFNPATASTRYIGAARSMEAAITHYLVYRTQHLPINPEARPATANTPSTPEELQLLLRRFVSVVRRAEMAIKKTLLVDWLNKPEVTQDMLLENVEHPVLTFVREAALAATPPTDEEVKRYVSFVSMIINDVALRHQNVAVAMPDLKNSIDKCCADIIKGF